MDQRQYHYRLRSCVWELTLSCCFSCKYCGSRAGTARMNELTTNECLNVAKQLADIGCERVSLIGGEVFIRPDWATIAKSLTERDVKVSIITNGYLFSDDLILQLKDAGIESVAISIDGPETIHDAFREKGSFHRAIHAIDVLSEGGIPVSVITTLHSRNVSHLEELYKELKRKNIFAWQLQACSPMGNASEAAFSTNICFKDVIQFVADNMEESEFLLGIADNIGYYTEEEGFIRGNPSGKAVFAGCRAGLSGIGIDSIGNVRGCEAMYDDYFIEGNLREKSLKEIWNAPYAFSYNRCFTVDLLTGKCKTCEFGKICAGGCRSYNYFSIGKMYESPNCARLITVKKSK